MYSRAHAGRGGAFVARTRAVMAAGVTQYSGTGVRLEPNPAAAVKGTNYSKASARKMALVCDI